MNFQPLVRATMPVLMLLSCNSVFAQTNLIVNGDFEQTTVQSSGQWDSHYPYVNVTGWTSAGYNFLFTPGSADTTGVYSSENTKQLILWGPNSGSANGLPATSPTGGNFVGMDGAYQVGAISQVITGLHAGHTYQLNFYWAAAQQHGYTGDTTEKIKATLGSQFHTTSTISNPSEAFSGWTEQSFDYIATGGTETLSLLAIGTPSGVPPFALIDGVSMYDLSEVTPEPGAMALAAAGFVGFAGAVVRRRRAARK